MLLKKGGNMSAESVFILAIVLLVCYALWKTMSENKERHGEVHSAQASLYSELGDRIEEVVEFSNSMETAQENTWTKIAALEKLVKANAEATEKVVRENDKVFRSLSSKVFELEKTASTDVGEFISGFRRELTQIKAQMKVYKKKPVKIELVNRPSRKITRSKSRIRKNKDGTFSRILIQDYRYGARKKPSLKKRRLKKPHNKKRRVSLNTEGLL